jgi:argininosuccinate lyase
MSKLWGGRFRKEMTSAVEAYSQSIDTDGRMVREDIWGSQAHAIMLAAQGIIAEDDLREILRWLEQARAGLESGEFRLKPELEDVHMNVETYLIEGAGADLGGRLHTARSRNDQAITDTRLRAREEIIEIERGVAALVRVMLDLAEANADVICPGFTHTQIAQPITLGFWASAHASALARDLERLAAAYGHTNLNPLGACALAGTSFPTDRALTTRLLAFDAPLEHALDAVSARDFVAETCAVLAVLAVNISRLAEEIVWWSNPAIGTVEVDDAYATGSSIMPQKKNPCMSELARGRTARSIGLAAQALALMKGLPLGYNRDHQEDRQALWAAFDAVGPSLEVIAGQMATIKVNRQRMAELAGAGFSTATELANYLVSDRGLPFRESHHIVGDLVAKLIEAGTTFADLETTRRLLADAGHDIAADTLRSLLDPAHAVSNYRSLGSTAPAEVTRMIGALRSRLDAADADTTARAQQIEAARKLTAEIAAGVTGGKALRELLPAS